MIKPDRIHGDLLGLEIPAHIEALRSGGEVFLTNAFRAFGALPGNNRIARISGLKEIKGGSTGRKAILSVEYDQPDPHLHTELFVKFSRDFDDEIRDQARSQMELEVLFARLSCDPDFPIAVPVCYLSEFHHASGTGILITQRIGYGANGVEPQYPKCLDYRLPHPLEHYQALIRALARLAGTHKAGRLPGIVEQYFPFDPGKLVVSHRARSMPEAISRRVARYSEFAAGHPGLLPANIRSKAFITRLSEEAPRLQAVADRAAVALRSRPEMIALCHWNAHIDNAWFWRSGSGLIECGLMDWGNVSQMNVAMALWGCLSGAEPDIWNDHLDDLLLLFIDEFGRCGGPALDLSDLKRCLTLYAATMGLEWMLDTPRSLQQIPGLGPETTRMDPSIENSERIRAQLLIMTNVLNLWEHEDIAGITDHLSGIT